MSAVVKRLSIPAEHGGLRGVHAAGTREHAALKEGEEERGRVNPESDRLAAARGLVYASVLSAAIYYAAWLLLRD
jgi:hypothetical protein